MLLVCISLFIMNAEGYAKHNQAKTWYEAPDAGWSWYIDPPLRSKPANRPDEKSQSLHPDNNAASKSDAQGSYVHTREMEKARKDFEELQARAILYPTLENVLAFQKAYNRIVNRSSNFEKTWMVSSLLSGENYREADWPSSRHRQIYQEKMEKQLEEDIFVLAKTHGLFFLFRKDCPYCHEMAPAVRQLADRYHFAIKAISPDGQPVEAFPDAVRDNGTIGQMNPEGVFPMVLLVNPRSGQTIPLARGLISPSELKENFKVIIRFLKEQAHAK